MGRAQLEKRKTELQQEAQKARTEMQRLTQAAARIDGAIILIDELLAEPDPEPEPKAEQ